MKLGVKIQRSAPVTAYLFTDYFKGFENVKIIKRIFGRRTNEILRNLEIEFIGWGGYMLVSDIDGHLIVSANYLKKGDIIDIYLDVIHELVHVKQLKEGMELFDKRFSYVDSPTEIEAHIIAVQEARRIGMNDEELADYLRVDWISEEEYVRLLRTLGVRRRIVS
jgi:hypothetical protein